MVGHLEPNGQHIAGDHPKLCSSAMTSTTDHTSSHRNSRAISPERMARDRPLPSGALGASRSEIGPETAQNSPSAPLGDGSSLDRIIETVMHGSVAVGTLELSCYGFR